MAVFQVIGLILIGLVIGLLARLLLPGRQKIGLVLTLALGIAGALIGGLVASYFGRGNIWELNFVGFVVAVLAAILLLAIAQAAGIGVAPPRPPPGPPGGGP